MREQSIVSAAKETAEHNLNSPAASEQQSATEAAERTAKARASCPSRAARKGRGVENRGAATQAAKPGTRPEPVTDPEARLLHQRFGRSKSEGPIAQEQQSG
jgi:hypothetical protein